MNLREATAKVLSSFQGHTKLSKDFNVACEFTDTFNEIQLNSVKNSDPSYYILVMEKLDGKRLAKELFGNDSKGGEKADGI